MKRSKHKNFWKFTMATALGAVALTAASFGAAFAGGNTSPVALAQANEAATATETESVYIQLDNQYLFIYPDYYRLGDVETAFSGTYIISGKNSSRKIFFMDGGETPTYNVIFHNFEADNWSYADVMQVNEGVTLNITARGENVIKGYNHPGIQVPEDYAEATVNITVEENASITFGANDWNQYPKSFGDGLTVNVLKGTASIADMTAEGWNNENLTVTNGTATFGHVTNYELTDDGLCGLYCETENVLLGKLAHAFSVETKDSAQHTLTCDNCGHSQDEAHQLSVAFCDEAVCAPVCVDCGYVETSLQTNHNYVDGVCESCGARQQVTVEVNGEKTVFAFLSNAVEYANEQESATISAIGDVDGLATVYSITGNVTLDLAGYTLHNIGWSVDAENASFTVVDSIGEGYLEEMDNSHLFEINQGSLLIQGGNFGSCDVYIKDTAKAFTVEGGVFSWLTYIEFEGYAPTEKIVAIKGGIFKSGVYVYGVYESGGYVPLGDLVPEGLAWQTEDGEWLDIGNNGIYEHIYFVEHTCKMADMADDDMHWIGCVCGRTEGEREWHDGGEATCTEKPICDGCGNHYGYANGHSFVEDSIYCTVCEVGVKPFLVSVADGDFYCEDIYSAFSKASEYAEAKITLQDNVESGRYTEAYVNQGGRYTLDLAGYSVFTDYVSVCELELIIEDSSAEGTGVWTVDYFYAEGSILTVKNGALDGDGSAWWTTVTVDGGSVAGEWCLYENAQLTVNGGSVAGEWDLYETTQLTVNDGSFKEWTVNAYSGSQATLNGGTFENTGFERYDDYGEGAGVILVKGGVFNGVTTFEAREDFAFIEMLADGYALKNAAGEYVDIYVDELEGDGFTVVEHTCDMTGTAHDANGHWAGCVCYRRNTDSVKEAHAYGEWQVVTPATQTQVGTKEKVCECGHTVTEEIPVLSAENNGSSGATENNGSSGTTENNGSSGSTENSGASGGGETTDKKGKGCGGVVDGSLAVVAVALAAVVLFKRKED